MAGSGPSVGVTFLAVVATLCISVVMGNMNRRNRACCDNERRTCKQDDNLKSTKNGRCRCGEATVDRGAGMDRRAPENEPVFSLYGGDGGDNDTEPRAPPMKLSASVLALLESFDVDPVRGFLPSVDPLRRLPQAELQPWEEMAAALPSLLAVGRARKPLEALPLLSIDVLTCDRERMRALLLLSIFAHASVWGNTDQPQDSIPKGIAIPLSALAAAEGLPPLLTHASVVLNNWHRLDPSGPIRTENLACNSWFLGGLDETWFYIATVEIEARGGGVFGALLEARQAIADVASASNPNNGRASAAARTVLEALAIAKDGIECMREALSRMPVGCHPLIFYQRVRPFLSGWKANPTLPNGVLYEGVSSRRQQYYGGSAAQSTLFPALDAALEVSHSKHPSNAFLLEMRKYMPPGHRRLLEHLADPACPSIRGFVQSFGNEPSLTVSGNGKDDVDKRTGSPGNGDPGSLDHGGHGSLAEGDRFEETTSTADALRDSYNGCLSALEAFRSTHMRIVGSYILQQQKEGQKAVGAKSRKDFAGGKGTGGTSLLDFLKPIKEDARAALLE